MERTIVEFTPQRLASISVMIGTPVYDQSITAMYVNSLFKTVNYFNHHGVKHGLLSFDGAVTEKSRNYIVARFMETGFSHLMCIDADQGWEPTDIMRLLAHEQDYVGAGVRKKTDDKDAWNVNPTEGAEVTDTGLLLVDEVGTGFCLIARRVFERMAKAMPEQRVTKDVPVQPFYRWFDPTVIDGEYLGEDINFARKWRTLCNGTIWVDVSITTSHIGRKDFRGCYGDHLLAAMEQSNADQDR